MVLPGLLCGIGLLCGAQGPGISASVAATCQTLEGRYPAEITLPSEDTYNAQYSGWAGNADQPPGCVAEPTSYTSAASMLSTIVSGSTPFAVRSGGHSMNVGHSSIRDGVLFSLSGLRRVEVDSQSQTVLIDAGNRWGDVYSQLSPLGYTVAGGRAANVGVGGLSLGGGVSFWAYTHGFGSDNIVAYTVLLASGEIQEVTIESDPELFRALKGSGAPFLIVLAFRYRLIPIEDPEGRVWGGTTISTGLSIPGVLKATAEFNQAGPADPKSHLISIVGMTAGVVDLTLTITAHQSLPPKGETPEVFKPFRKAQAVGTVIGSTIGHLGIPSRPLEPTRVEDISDGQSPEFVKGRRQIMKHLTVSNPDADFLARCVEITKQEFLLPSLSQGVTVALSFIPLGPVISSGGNGNVMGISGDRLMHVYYHVQWDLEKVDESAIRATDRGIQRMIDEAKERGVWNKWVYLNYAKYDDDPISSYGAENVEFLKRVEQRVDPTGVWRTLVKGGFKIPA